jgi:serine/threonine protein kinase/WD40 repeat protein
MPLSPQQEESLVRAVLEMPAEQRKAFLDTMCAGDAGFRSRLAELIDRLEKHSTAPDQPQHPPATVKIEPPPEDEAIGKSIGHYKLLQKIGEGGCGAVYMADQEQPVHRRVALKVIKLGMDTKVVIARFEAERQALALMDHPNIAKVLDAGSTEIGRPYFVMELVRGIKITEYCDQNKVATRERVELFIKICQAIQHAHQKGIIHRDIKPSNILVTLHDGVPIPKVIDFGIAKATTDQRLTDKTLFTAYEQFIGTPAYMSPEQAEMSGLDVDTRSDIYSLGVLLYELLTGRTPFDAQELMKSGLDAMRRTIREEEPVRPSTKVATLKGEELTTTAARRGAEPPRLVKLLRGDLDWIVMKCLEKDRTRRYETANGLALDLLRFLNSELVLARPPSQLYRFQKSIRRNRLSYTAAAAVLAALIAGLASTIWMYAREREAHQKTLAAELEQKRLRVAAQRAQAGEAREKLQAQAMLYSSLLGEARATRLARRMGYRESVFGLLTEAGKLDVPDRKAADLRNEAAACLGDFVGLVPQLITNLPDNLSFAHLDSQGKQAAFATVNGEILLRQTLTGAETVRFNIDKDIVDACFNPAGNRLFVTSGPAGTWEKSLPKHGLAVFRRDDQGQWRAAEIRPFPGASDLIGGEPDTLCSVLEWVSGTGPGDTRRGMIYRLYNLETGLYLPGYALTNFLAEHVELLSEWPCRARLVMVKQDFSVSTPLVEVYDWKTGTLTNQFQLPMRGALNLSRDGNFLSLSTPNGCTVYTVPSFESIGALRQYITVPAVFSHDRMAVPIFSEHHLVIWNLNSRQEEAVIFEPNDAVPVDFSPDGYSLLTLENRSGEVHRLTTPEKLAMSPHAAAATCLAFSPDGLRLASISKDRVLKVEDSQTGKTLWRIDSLPGPGQSVACSPDGEWIAAGSWNTEKIWIVDARSGQRRCEIGTDQFLEATWSLSVSPDSHYLVAAGVDTRIWAIEKSSNGQGASTLHARMIHKLSEQSVGCVFSPVGNTVAFWDQHNGKRSVCIWDIDHAQEPLKIPTHSSQSVQCLSFTPDGRQLLSLNRNGDVSTLDLATRQDVAVLHFENSSLSRWGGGLMSLSPDGSKIALSSVTGLGVEIRDAKSGKLLLPLPEENGSVYWMTWSPDSRRVAVARDIGSVAIWELGAVEQILAQFGPNP